MCGVLAHVGAQPPAQLRAALGALRHRGPDAAGLLRAGRVTLGHARLAILDLDPRSNQPFVYGTTLVSYAGELWNYRELRAQLAAAGAHFTTTGDTEVVAAALDRWAWNALPRLEGMFALAWTTGDGELHLARDRFGEHPLHYARLADGSWAAASEWKALKALGATGRGIIDVEPGSHTSLAGRWQGSVRWYYPPAAPIAVDRETAAAELRARLRAAVGARTISDVGVCTLLSGGLDSAAIAAELVDHLGPGQVRAYTAVLDLRARDRRCAHLVAEHLGVELVEVDIPVPTADDLARTVAVVELGSKAQVEIAWPCLHLAARMHADGAKVTFAGEGSDELWASYGFAYHGLKTTGWHDYRRTLVLAQARRNFPRANKAFAAFAVEARLPFLHTPVVEYALSLPRQVVQDGRARPKAVLADAYADRLPSEVLRRAKVAFQDGLGLKRQIAGVVADPARFYRAELLAAYG